MRCHPVISDRTHLRAGWLACAGLRTALIRVVRWPDPVAAGRDRGQQSLGAWRLPSAARGGRASQRAARTRHGHGVRSTCASRGRARVATRITPAQATPAAPARPTALIRCLPRHDPTHTGCLPFSAHTTALAPLADRRHSLGVVADRGGADVAAAQLRRSKPRAIEPEGFESPKYRQKTGNKKPRRCAVSAKHGGRGGNRTPDTGIFNPLLYQLSYPAR